MELHRAKKQGQSRPGALRNRPPTSCGRHLPNSTSAKARERAANRGGLYTRAGPGGRGHFRGPGTFWEVGGPARLRMPLAGALKRGRAALRVAERLRAAGGTSVRCCLAL